MFNHLFIIILISVSLLYLYIKKTLNCEFFDNNKNVLNKYGIPYHHTLIKKKTAYISVICKDYLDIYLDKGSQINTHQVDLYGKFIGRADNINSLNIFHFNTEFDYKNKDRLIFYHLNVKDNGFWAGHIYLDGKFYPTNSNNYSIVGIENRNIIRMNNNSLTSSKYGFSNYGKKIACYKFNNKLSFINPYPGKKFTYEECSEIANKYSIKSYGLKDYGGCIINNKPIPDNYITSDYKCNKPNLLNLDSKKNLKYIQTSGGKDTIDLHSTYNLPDVRNCGIWPYLRLYKRADGLGNATLIDKTKSIKPKTGSSCSNTIYNRWVQYEFNL